MRWLKHLSMAHADEAIAFVVEEHGAAAYGIYWFLVEEIAAPMEPGKLLPMASHSIIRWAAICHCSTRVFKSVALLMQERGLIFITPRPNGVQSETEPGSIRAQSELNRRPNGAQSGESRWQIEIPTILKYKDEYSKKSRHGSDQEQRESRGRADTEGEQMSSSSGYTEASVGTNGTAPPPPPALLPILNITWKTDEAYAPLVAAWHTAKADAIDEDFERGYKIWVTLGDDRQEQALRHLQERVRTGLPTSTTLGYWLREDYKRPAVESNRNGHGARAPDRKRETTSEKVNRIVQERISKGQDPFG